VPRRSSLAALLGAASSLRLALWSPSTSRSIHSMIWVYTVCGQE
jgi:hypothetical protein